METTEEFPIQEYRGPALGCSPEEFAAYLEREYAKESPLAGEIYLAIHNGEPIPYYLIQGKRLPKGINSRHLKVVKSISQNPGKTCEEIAGEMGVHRSTASGLLDLLRRVHWVTRRRSKKNQPYQYFPEQWKL